MEHRASTDIARDMKSIEWLKTELLGNVSQLFKEMYNGDDAVLADHLATIVLTAYVLGRRLGVDFDQLDAAIQHTVKANVDHPHEFERWYGDFTAMAKHFQSGER